MIEGKRFVLLVYIVVTAVRAQSLTQRFKQVVRTEYENIGPAGSWIIPLSNYPQVMRGSYGNPSMVNSGLTLWVYPQTALVKLDVGLNTVWGINLMDQVIVRTGISRTNEKGTTWNTIAEKDMMDVSVDEKNNVWAVGSDNNAYRRTKITNDNVLGEKWKKIDGVQLKQISVGRVGVWGVTNDNQLYYREGTYNKGNVDGERWTKVGDNIKEVASGYGYAWCINTNNVLQRRTGITSSTPSGNGWETDLGSFSRVVASSRVVVAESAIANNGYWWARME